LDPTHTARQVHNSSQVTKPPALDGAIIAVADPATTMITKSLPKNSDITLNDSRGIKTAAADTTIAMRAGAVPECPTGDEHPLHALPFRLGEVKASRSAL